jgi:hypothetical protein
MILAALPPPPAPVIELSVGQAFGFAVVFLLFLLMIGPKQ